MRTLSLWWSREIFEFLRRARTKTHSKIIFYDDVSTASCLLLRPTAFNLSMRYEIKTFTGLDHSVSIDELNDVAAFLTRVIPPIAIATKTDNDNLEDVVIDPTKMSVGQLRAEIEKRGQQQEARGMLEMSELVNLPLKCKK